METEILKSIIPEEIIKLIFQGMFSVSAGYLVLPANQSAAPILAQYPHLISNGKVLDNLRHIY